MDNHFCYSSPFVNYIIYAPEELDINLVLTPQQKQVR